MSRPSSWTLSQPLKFTPFGLGWTQPSFRAPTKIHVHTDSEETGALDDVYINGGLYEVWTPHDNGDVVTSVVHVFVRFVVSFTFSKSVDMQTIKAQLEGSMNVTYWGSEPAKTSFLNLQWVLWDKGELEAGKKYKFRVLAELPITAPCSIETSKGSIDYTFQLRFAEMANRGHSVWLTSPLKIWNPYVVFDVPRQGLTCGGALVSEMVGTTIKIDKDLTAFLRYPDQWSNGTSFELRTCIDKR
jgi:hypothetical protein